MKLKKTACLLLSAVLFLATLTPICAFANADLADKDAEENMAWLSDFYIRESAYDFVKDEVMPNKGIYNSTAETFVENVNGLKKLYDMDYSTMAAAYEKILTDIFTLIDEANLTVGYDEMKAYLQDEWQIVYPEQDDARTATYTTIAYACLRTDILQSLLKIDVTIEPGTSINRTIVLILGAITGEEIDADVETLMDYAVVNIKKILIDNGYQVSENADPQEFLLLYKIMIATEVGYPIENQNVAAYTDADKAYVQGAYTAAVIKLTYGISPSVEDVLAATASEDENAVAMLILRTMIVEAGETWTEDETLADLFERGCQLGYFDLEYEFYSDVYNYDVYLQYDCDEIWLTPFAFAAEKGYEKLQYLTMTINGDPVENSRSYKLAVNDDVTTATVALKYDDGETVDEATYTFTIYNGTQQQPNVTLPVPSDNVDNDFNMDLEYYEDLLNSESSAAPAEDSNLEARELSATPYDLSDTQSALITAAAADTAEDDAEPAVVTSVQTASNTTSPDTGLSDMNMALIIGAVAVVVIAGGITAFVLVKRKKEAGR